MNFNCRQESSRSAESAVIRIPWLRLLLKCLRRAKSVCANESLIIRATLYKIHFVAKKAESTLVCLTDPDLATLPESFIVMICFFHKHFIKRLRFGKLIPLLNRTLLSQHSRQKCTPTMLPKNSSRPFETLHQLEVIQVHGFI